MKPKTRAWLGLGLVLLLAVLLILLLPENGRQPAGERGTRAPQPVERIAAEQDLLRLPAPGVRKEEPSPAPEDASSGDASDSVGGVVTGRIVVPEGRAPDIVALHLYPERPQTRRGEFEFEFRDDGAFRIGRVAEGTYRLELRLHGHLPGTHAIPGIVVRPSETVSLEPIALETLIQVVRIDVRDESGARISNGTMWLPSKGSGWQGWLEASSPKDDEGVLLLRSLGPPPEQLRIIAPGFIAAELANPRPSEVVVLVRGPRVHLELHGGLPRLREPWYLLVSLVQDGVWEQSPLPFDPHGRATSSISRSGRFYVGLSLQHPDETGHHSLDGLDWWIDVKRGSTDQAFTSPPFTAKFLDNIERLTRGP